MIPNPTPIVDMLPPLLRQFVLGQYGIALGGAHAKGVEDRESDVDIYGDHLRTAKFWPENLHYRSAVARCDAIYAAGIVHQVVHNLIQILFALNRTYFPGDKKLDIALEHLEVKPAGFTERIKRLLLPGTGRDRDTLDRQRTELIALTRQVEELVVKKPTY